MSWLPLTSYRDLASSVGYTPSIIIEVVAVIIMITDPEQVFLVILLNEDTWSECSFTTDEGTPNITVGTCSSFWETRLKVKRRTETPGSPGPNDIFVHSGHNFSSKWGQGKYSYVVLCWNTLRYVDIGTIVHSWGSFLWMGTDRVRRREI